jgi:predicted outer membrane protein
MKRLKAAFLLLLIGGCVRSGTRNVAPPFDSARFISHSLIASMSNADLGALAAKRGRLPETRQFGDAMHREQSEMLTSLTALAQQRKIGVPQQTEEKRVALKDNLQVLPGQVFDRGYALAMVQDLDSAIATFDTASTANDRDVQQFAQRYRPVLVAREREASALLNRLGGSPF